VAGRKVHIALDGEVVRMEAPLRFEAKSSALKVLAAPSEQLTTG
jgi:diacylglycerol kinase family enzyme